MSLDVIAAPSPNFNERKRPLRYVVLHYTGMENGPVALERMCDPGAQVSAHYMVEEDGRIFRLVDEGKRAWHAGVSCWQGETDMNSASIGIEIVNGGHDFGLPGFPAVQIEAVIALVGDVLRRHRLSPRDVIGHSDIAPARKQDPGEKFPWHQLAAAGVASGVEPDARPAGGEIEDLLRSVGYCAEAETGEVIAAFQRRYRPSDVGGQLDDETEVLIRRIASGS